MSALFKDILSEQLPMPAIVQRDAGRQLGSQPTIRTGRLTLRRPDADDAQAVTDALANHRVARMLARVPQPYHLEDAEEWLAGVAADQPPGWIFAITLGGIRAMLTPDLEAANGNQSDRLVGMLTIEWREVHGRAGWHIGYWLAEEQWGKGIMTEAVNAVLARFFSAHMGEVLYSSVMADNPASLKIQGKLGFDITGVGEAYSEGRAAMARLILTEVTFGGYMPN